MSTLTPLLRAPRIKITANLAPLAGTRFQPTGFPDLGPATYQGPDGEDMLLVESAQSMANWLENAVWNEATGQPVAALNGVPYVVVADGDGQYLTSSRTESHRLASAYIKAADFDGESGLELILRKMNLRNGHAIDHAAVHRTVIDLDPLALIHGAFFADKRWFGQPKIARAITSFVEASGVRPAHSGGVKFDHVSNTGDVEGRTEGRAASEEGFGNVPFPRTEFVASRVTAWFVIDTHQIASYQLDEPQRELLLAIALLEVRTLLDNGLRLRTACDLEVESFSMDRPAGVELPSSSDLVEAIAARSPGAEPLTGTFE